jgi:Polyketide cyclase / dehydrase and lipid transport
MKVLLILVAGLVLLILGVAVVGVWLPKRHVVSRSASYRVTPEQLFSLIAGAQTWRPDVTKWETVSADGGRELTRETTGDGETITYEVLDRVPPVSLKRRIATENLPYAGTWSYALQSTGENTVLRITEDGQVYNPMFRFMSRFVFGQTRTMDTYLRALAKATGQEITVKD